MRKKIIETVAESNKDKDKKALCEKYKSQIEKCDKKIEELQKQIKDLNNRLWKYTVGEIVLYKEDLRRMRITGLIVGDKHYLYEAEFLPNQNSYTGKISLKGDEIMDNMYDEKYSKALHTLIGQQKAEIYDLKMKLNLK